ncbi:MAG: TetR/AcrR family transcriptional regulator [Spirochaetales bacterium]|uniref:TetR/AcrR family transcriptional regulator n=1 Tax=Candidatus Thalassospirochaeta sargassi TaxID=3119039 RepID=A0AAJ1IC94_9SPIO|nr:TetR/AcrR family transcriptional regulator [Spirochaetales bacterium]
MSASELQKQRMTQYFIDAAKEILRGEGLKVASARNIADKAGYSYATLYNYFEDLTSLIFECVRDFQAELEALITPAVESTENGADKIRRGVTAWINYFVQYPGIFELFFLERIGEVGHRSDIADVIYASIEPACQPGLDQLVSEGSLTQNEAETKMNSIRFQITGLLLYYGNRKNPSDYTGLIKTLDRQIELLIS